MDKRKVFNKAYLRSVVASRASFGEKGSVPLDQSYSKDFNVDPCTGRPMTDVQRLVKEQNDVAMQAAFAQLHEFKSSFLPQDMSDSDALRFMCPRLSQLPSELVSYREGLAKYQLKLQEDAVLKANLEKQAKEESEFIEKFKNDIKSSKLD